MANRKVLLILSIFICFLLLLIGNINYYARTNTTGRAVEEVPAVSQTESEIAEKIANNELKSNVDVREKVDLEIKEQLFKNKIIEFDTDEGKISLEFNLLDYGKWVEDESESTETAENFDINVQESKEKYKWGYNVKLNDLNFMAKIEINADNIQVIDNQTLKIGKNYISFSDLAKQGYIVRVEMPVVLSEINLTETNIIDVNITEINETQINVTETNATISDINESELNVTKSNQTINETIVPQNETSEINETTEINESSQTSENETIIIVEVNITGTENESSDEENIPQSECSAIGCVDEPTEKLLPEINENQQETENTEQEYEEQTEENKIIKEPELSEIEITETITGGVIKFITGFVIHGLKGLTGLVIQGPNHVSIYVQKDFNNTNYSIGDIINLDPYLIIIEITKAQHLDEQRIFVEDIYEDVKAQDNVWKLIPDNHFIRINFEQNLTNEKDITIYARATENSTSEIEVYRQDSDEVIAKFENIIEENWYKVYLTNLPEGESYNVFDLKILGSVEFDYIVDPEDTIAPNIIFGSGTPTDGSALSTNSIFVNVSASDSASNISTFIDFDNSLLGWWRMDEIGGSPYFWLIDNSSYGNNAVVYNAVGTDSGYLGIGMEFDGAGDYINCGSDSSLDFYSNRNYTYAGWFKSDNIATTQTIINHQCITNGDGLAVSLKSSKLTVYSGDGMAAYSSALSSNTWYHFVVVYEYYGDVYIYINGVADGSCDYFDFGSASSEDLYIGYGECWDTGYFNGILDDIMIFNRILSTEEIYGLYANKSSEYLTHNFTNLGGGTYTFKAYTQDLAGNINSTERSVTITDISSCRTLNQANTEYTQTTDITQTANEDCIIISAENITYNCNGYAITSSNLVSGIYSNQSNTTIKNCNVSMGVDWGWRGGFGIKLIGANNSYIYNNTLNDQGYGLYLYSTSNTKIENNTANSNSAFGIILYSSSNNTLTGITATANSNYGGIRLSSSSDNNISDSNLSGNSVNDVYLVSSSTNNIFLNTTYSTESVASGSSLIRKWYYRAHVMDNSSTDVGNASVQAYNLIGALILNLTTNTSGWTLIGDIIDYVNTGGTRTYYSNYISVAWENATSKRTAYHNLNITALQNYLNDSFIILEDLSAPILSEPWYTATTTTATIYWTTDDVSNSSVNYWGPDGVVHIVASDDQFAGINPHIITITGLSSNTTYTYNITSCSRVSGCGSSSQNYQFTTAVQAGQTISGGGGGITCYPNWICSNWPACIGTLGQQVEQTRTCVDDNHCGTTAGKPTETQTCTVTKEPEKPTATETPLGTSKGGGGWFGTCTPNWQCSNWGECKAVYNIQEIISEKVLLEGEQERKCIDKNNCEYEKIERRECETRIPVYAKKVEKCFKNYIEVFDNNNILISRLELIDGGYQKLNVQMLFDDSGYCPYCFDGQLNYNEDEIDCSYDGVDCPICSLELPFVRGNYSLMLITLIGLTLISFLFIIWYLILLRKTKKGVIKIIKMSKLNFTSSEKFKAKRKLKNRFKIISLIVLGLIGILVIGFFVFKLLSNSFIYITENFDSFAFLFNIYSLILPVLILLSLIIFIWIIKIINRRKLRKIFRKEVDILRHGIIKEKEEIKKEVEKEADILRYRLIKEGDIVKKEIKKEANILREISIDTKKKAIIIYKNLAKEYKKDYKRLIKLRKKIFKKKERIIKKENEIGRPLEKKRKRFKQDVERYKMSIEKLKILKGRIKNLEDLGYSTRETKELKYKLDKDIENLRNKSK